MGVNVGHSFNDISFWFSCNHVSHPHPHDVVSARGCIYIHVYGTNILSQFAYHTCRLLSSVLVWSRCQTRWCHITHGISTWRTCYVRLHWTLLKKYKRHWAPMLKCMRFPESQNASLIIQMNWTYKRTPMKQGEKFYLHYVSILGVPVIICASL